VTVVQRLTNSSFSHAGFLCFHAVIFDCVKPVISLCKQRPK